jgi:hypothetical protein
VIDLRITAGNSLSARVVGMAGTYDFFLTDTIEQARERVTAAVSAQGFTLDSTPNGGFVVSRGSMGRTLLLGAFAGKNMHLRFDIQFFSDDQQRIVVRLSRDLASGALKGGVIGASKTANSFADFVNATGAALHSAGVVAETREA